MSVGGGSARECLVFVLPICARGPVRFWMPGQDVLAFAWRVGESAREITILQGRIGPWILVESAIEVFGQRCGGSLRG